MSGESEDARLLSFAGVAAYLGVPEWTVRKWHSAGTGPRSYRVGRYRRFRRSDVDLWLETRASDSGEAA